MKNDNGEQMVEHHVKYLELHGEDKTVWMTRSEHQNLHRRLRKEGKCNIPPDELKKIVTAACNRTDKVKERIKNNKIINKFHKLSVRSYNVFSDLPVERDIFDTNTNVMKDTVKVRQNLTVIISDAVRDGMGGVKPGDILEIDVTKTSLHLSSDE